MTRKYVQARKIRLNSPVGTSDTEFLVTNLKDIYGNELSMTDFGTEAEAVIDPGIEDSAESILITDIVDNGDGTWVLTVSRGREAKSDYGAGGTAREHSAGAKIIITNTAGFYDSFVNKKNNETMEGYLKVLDPVESLDAANKQWVISMINGGPVSFEKIVITGNAGENIVDGESVYLNTSDGEWYKTAGATLSTVKRSLKGIAQGAGSNGVAISGGILLRGVDDAQSGGSLGSLGYISNTAGDIDTTPGTYGSAVGVFLSATEFYFDPNWQNGDTIQNNDFVYQADAGSSDSYAITLDPVLGSYRAGLMVHFMANTANTGASTLNINGLGAKKIVKNVNYDLATGDIFAGQISTVIYDGTNFQLLSKTPKNIPVTTIKTVQSRIGSETTRFDVTNTSGTTFRYTYDGTGTDPNISAANFPVGTPIDIRGENFSAGNKGLFIITGSGTNYFEVTNASGVAENDKTLGTGTLTKGEYYLVPENLEGAIVEIQGGGQQGDSDTSSGASAGGSGGASAGYAKKTYKRSDLVTLLGDKTTQFDITNPSGTTFRYTYDGTGTDPSISATSLPIGYSVRIKSNNFNSDNNGTFTITGVGSNYFEVTNASGVVESNKTIGLLGKIEIISIPIIVGRGGSGSSSVRSGLFQGARTLFKSLAAYGYVKNDIPNAFTATGGDININGKPGLIGDNILQNMGRPGNDSVLGQGGYGGRQAQDANGNDLLTGGNGLGYGSGGGGGGYSGSTQAGGDGAHGVIMITEL